MSTTDSGAHSETTKELIEQTDEGAQELVARAPLNTRELVLTGSLWPDVRYSRRIARANVQARMQGEIRTTGELAAVVERAVPASYRHGRIHCATRTFQALRIAVNRELDVLEPALRDAVDILVPGGRVCAISFHSLEDRIVKHTFRAMANGPDASVTVLTKKPVIASDDERNHNPRSRSAKLRVVERIAKESMS